MTPQDRKAFVEVVLGFAELKGKQLSAPALELYWRSLQHWSLNEFRTAAEQLLRTCEFMPLPKHFEDLRKAGRPTAGEAWRWVLSRYPAHRCQVETLDEEHRALIERTVQAIGGWHVIDMCEVEKIHFLERRFAEHYADIQDAEDVREAVPEIAFDRNRLAGPTSASNLLGRMKRDGTGGTR